MKIINKYNNFINESNNDVYLGKFINLIDFTFIKTSTKEMLINFLDDAKKLNPYSICIKPDDISTAKYHLDGTDIKITSILDFPNGTSNKVDKRKEAINLISNGVDEIDMVMNYKLLKKAYIEVDEDTKNSIFDKIENEIKIVANECHKNGIILKVIIESGLLNHSELEVACDIVSNAGADFIQTSTGTKQSGNDLSKIKEIRRLIPDYMKIKISGGIRTLQQCNLYYPYIDRIGTSIIPK